MIENVLDGELFLHDASADGNDTVRVVFGDMFGSADFTIEMILGVFSDSTCIEDDEVRALKVFFFFHSNC